jgi:cysteine desulfurase
MLPWLGERFGNASSRHEYGRAARKAIDEARAQVAAAVNAHPTEVIFTSGGSEANNLFIKGAAAVQKPGLVAVSAVEHPACGSRRGNSSSGWRFAEIAVDGEGRIDIPAFARCRRQAEAGVGDAGQQRNRRAAGRPALAAQVRAGGGWMHCDAVQALGKIPLDFRGLGVHGLSLSAHKIQGPLGAGALIVDKRVELAPSSPAAGRSVTCAPAPRT